MTRTARLLILLLLLLASLASGSRVCTTIHIGHGGYATHRNVSRLHAQLTDSVAGCQFVFGDVVIENFGVNRFSEEPLDGAIRSLRTDFLDSIVEISGQLVIKRVNLERITLHSLRTIRGYNPEKKSQFYSVEVLQSKYPTRLELPRLSSIVHGDVRIIGNLHAHLYCYLSRSIDWTNLFQSHRGLQQQFIDSAAVVTLGNRQINAWDLNEVETACSSLMNCHDSCPTQTSGKKMCWSDGPNGCQSFHGCLSMQPCHSCYRHPVTGSEECCDPDCLGGCSGRPEACSACRGVKINGVCRRRCSPLETGELGMKQMGNICVRKCDMPFLTISDNNYCLRQCPSNEIPVNGVCKRCAVGSCRACTVQSLILSDKISMTLRNNGCVIWEAAASLDINAQLLTSSASLESLGFLQVFYGRLFIKRTHRLGVDNLRFLRNLRYVSDTFAILLLETRYIGLVSLEFAHHLLLRDISGLCKAWFPSKRIREIQEVTKEFPISIVNLRFDEASEVCRKAACDTRCRDECWGPGPDMCVVRGAL